MKTRYGNYKEYHTSLDKLGTVVTKKGLEESYKLIKDCIINIERNFRPKHYCVNLFYLREIFVKIY